MTYRSGDKILKVKLQNIHGHEFTIPDLSLKWVHLQFCRFAGCPISNLHLQAYINRHSEIKRAGIREVVIFHSPQQSLIPCQGQFPFDVIADPEKKLYEQFGVTTSWLAVLNPNVWPAIFKGSTLKGRPKFVPEGGPLGLPADFLIAPNGTITLCHYGKNAGDQWDVDEVLAQASLRSDGVP